MTSRRSRPALSLLIVALMAVGSACGPPFAPASPAETAERTRRVDAIDSAALSNGQLALPNAVSSVKFAVIGDSGRGWAPQHEVAQQMERFRERFKYNFVLMLGDNIYEGPADDEDYRTKFELPYAGLIDDDVKFFAVLGNHDDPRQVWYAPFQMKGERYYSFVPPEDVLTRIATPVEFFALDSTNLDSVQLEWLDERLSKSKADWKIVMMHHPLYTSGRYRTSSRLHRWVLEPLLVRHHVDAVFSGHEHIYQRSTLQNGIQYFISGGAGSLRRGDGEAGSYIARSYSSDYHFMLVEIDSKGFHIQAISRTGETIDAATLTRGRGPAVTTAADREGHR